MAKKLEGCLGVDAVCEFLEVAWHQLLYIRDLYPSSAFGRRRMYGVSVKMCLHPGVVNYIVKVLETVRHCLGCNDAESVVLAVRNSQGAVVEQYTFEAFAPAAQTAVEGEDAYLLELEAAMRASLLRLVACAGAFPCLDKGCTFAILLKTQSDAAEKLSVLSTVKVNPLLWVEANDGEKAVGKLRLLPINSFASQHVRLQLFAQTSALHPTPSAGTASVSLDW